MLRLIHPRKSAQHVDTGPVQVDQVARRPTAPAHHRGERQGPIHVVRGENLFTRHQDFGQVGGGFRRE